jgi:hypothetical protein
MDDLREQTDMTETTDPRAPVYPSTRLLPWQTEGKPAYLMTDPSGTSPLARLADGVEADQIASAEEVLRLSGRPEVDTARAGELRWIIARLRESLTETLRIAESRGMRLPIPDDLP